MNRPADNIDGAPPLPDPQRQWALFLDLDGTLVALVDHHDAIEVDDALRRRLKQLDEQLDGALAVVSGRAIDDLDRHLGLPWLALGGQHGAEWRESGGERQLSDRHQQALEAVRQRLDERLDAHDGLVVEDKGASIAIHYRHCPQAAEPLEQQLRELIAPFREALELNCGKFVFEIRGSGLDKGAVVARFLALETFRDRTPIFIGDDVTDEDGFRVARERGGWSVLVGDRDSDADFRLPGPPEVHGWLDRWIAALKKG
ncbi:trehalose-phosphatase [Kushneria aurantia]|uniref:Trehalose 6-phosphate phosphatase n=1 Tax=Kushneria aurantia TaxID=504092 RepID=A0ABV6G451_9GAMM|nr:trehalose-phosphatase [Kushneria aurantia]